MFSGASDIVNSSIGRTVYGFQPMVTSLYPASRFTTAGQDYMCTTASTGADHGIPAMQVLKFDGSPEKYPVFSRRFDQIVGSKALDEPTKMARLIQFLEGPVLLAVQRYESIPGGLTRALHVLQDRFGQPFKVVRACIKALIKGPVIAPQDRHGLRSYADKAQVMYDTLESMACLGEMNTDNLEKMILTEVGPNEVSRVSKEPRTSRSCYANFEGHGQFSIEQRWLIIRSSQIQYLR